MLKITRTQVWAAAAPGPRGQPLRSHLSPLSALPDSEDAPRWTAASRRLQWGLEPGRHRMTDKAEGIGEECCGGWAVGADGSQSWWETRKRHPGGQGLAGEYRVEYGFAETGELRQAGAEYV